MIRKLKANKITLLNRISASQYYSALSCPYKLVLANSFGHQPLLPVNVNAYFGSIIHKMIELISKGEINDEQKFSENWTALINKKEKELIENGLVSITPLKYFVTDFALKKNQVKALLQKRKVKFGPNQMPSLAKYYPEKRLENKDGTIVGIADLIIENDEGITILDFKTGKIYSEAIDECGVIEHVIKKEYEMQLKLYAHLYFLITNKYPAKLFLVTLSNDFIEVEFESSECEKNYSEALVFLSNINISIDKGTFAEIAKPSIENCKYCSYRPACEFYSRWLPGNFENTSDLTGILDKITQFNNGSFGLQLNLNDKQVLVNGFTNNSDNNFKDFLNKEITLYSLKKTRQSLNATANSYTIVYE